MAAVLKAVGSIVPNPTELMLLSVLRHGERELMEHSALVCAIALTVATTVGVHPELMHTLARAALLHDVGELYLPPSLFAAPDLTDDNQIREIWTHPLIGEQVVIELARSGSAVGHLIALSHERLDGWGYPHGWKLGDLSHPAQALLFGEAMAPLLEAGADPLRRAAVAARLIPGEFATEMVKWMGNCGSQHPVVAQSMSGAESIGLELRQIHSLLARILVLLQLRLRETSAAQATAAHWLEAVEGLIQLLRRSGVEEALSCGMNVEPQDEPEMIELSMLSRALHDRIRTLRVRVEQSRSNTPELGSSAPIIELLEALHACEPAPDRAGQARGFHITTLPWSNLFCVGVREIDEQHRVLIGFVNRLGDAGNGAAASEVRSDILAGLVEYVRKHFATEERLMLQHGYVGAAAHIDAHRKFSQRVEQMLMPQDPGTEPELGELSIFLRQWLIAHILHTDKELGMALNAKGVR